MKISLILFALVIMASCSKETEIAPSETHGTELESVEFRKKKRRKERVVVANRISGDISVINAKNNKVIGTYIMPDNGEPMYVVHVRQAGLVYVGDRANNRVVAFDEKTFAVMGTVPAGNGVFHMWASPNGKRLWVNNDIDNTTTVINPITMQVRGTAATPADLVALGGKPHDVFAGPNNKFAYVSVLGVAGANDYIIKYNNQFQEVGRTAVGKDPHIYANRINNKLYVPCQNSNSVYVIRRGNMTVKKIIPFTGAHGIVMPRNGQYVYVADIGNSEIGVIDTYTNTKIGNSVPAPFSTAHNLAINRKGKKLFVTHSGATANQLSIYKLKPMPSLKTTVTVGTNPFGLAYYTFR